jgi:hypothetical protein
MTSRAQLEALGRYKPPCPCGGTGRVWVPERQEFEGCGDCQVEQSAESTALHVDSSECERILARVGEDAQSDVFESACCKAQRRGIVLANDCVSIHDCEKVGA